MKKINLGQFFTKQPFWKKRQVLYFINKYKFNFVLDPFAGNGDLLFQFNRRNVKKIGLDIDRNLERKWEFNDSLKKIPFYKNTFVLTNPPYLSKSSSKRKKINHKAFNHSSRNDLYKIALDKLLESKMPGIAIIPESFINSTYSKKNIYSITILIPNPFQDTETPVCIICYDPNKEFKKTRIYRNGKFIASMNQIKEKETRILKKNNQIKVKFNSNKGKLSLIAYDSKLGKKISFMKSKELKYKRPQKESSRMISKIDVNKYVSKEFVQDLNERLKKYRDETKDVFLTPFKGNDNLDKRRRRLDYKTARRIINSLKIDNENEAQSPIISI